MGRGQGEMMGIEAGSLRDGAVEDYSQKDEGTPV